jgi:hypothetical protein
MDEEVTIAIFLLSYRAVDLEWIISKAPGSFLNSLSRAKAYTWVYAFPLDKLFLFIFLQKVAGSAFASYVYECMAFL